MGYVLGVTSRATDAARVQIALRLDPGQLDRIDRLAERQGRVRSDVIRRCIEHGLAAEANGREPE